MLDKNSRPLFHNLQNLALVILSLVTLPLSTFILFLSYVLVPIPSPRTAGKPRVVLITGVSMTKGLFLARAFYTSGHKVIGADFSPLAPGRFSRSVSVFHVLTKPSETAGSSSYTADLLRIIATHHVDIWVSCSGVASAVQDGEAKEAVESQTACKCVQFNVTQTETLHEKDSFIEHVRGLGLAVPQTHVVRSRSEAHDVLAACSRGEAKSKNRMFVLKCIGMDDSSRDAIATLLPRPTSAETASHLERFDISESNPFILQQYIRGSEYCTHALVLRGEVKAFCACPSSDMLMHYESLPADSSLSRAMLDFTTCVAQNGGSNFTGHLSFDFLVDAAEMEAAEQMGSVPRLHPIECNPRAHTAVALFRGVEQDMVDAYMSLLEPETTSERCGVNGAPAGITGGLLSGVKQRHRKGIVRPCTPSPKIYWTGHDAVTLLFLPLLGFLSGQVNFLNVLQSISTFSTHLLRWQDGTYEFWDPVPWWMLNQVFWPAIFADVLICGKQWTRVNVSTGKIFGC